MRNSKSRERGLYEICGLEYRIQGVGSGTQVKKSVTSGNRGRNAEKGIRNPGSEARDIEREIHYSGRGGVQREEFRIQRVRPGIQEARSVIRGGKGNAERGGIQNSGVGPHNPLRVRELKGIGGTG